jgi:hypothetical protein
MYQTKIRAVIARLAAMRYQEVVPENPYRHEKGAVTIEDPDGWRLVQMPTTWIN